MADDASETSAFSALAGGELAGGEARAWALFEEAWGDVLGRLQAFLAALGVAPKLREDCGQAVLLRVWRFRKGYRGHSEAELAAWMYRIAHNESARLATREGRAEDVHAALEAQGELVDAAAPHAGAEVEESETRRALASCLERLEPNERAVIELLYAPAGPSERESEAVLGFKKSWIHTLRQRALASLARCLSAKGVS